MPKSETKSMCFLCACFRCLFVFFLVFLHLEEIASSFPRTWARFTSLHLQPLRASASFHSVSAITCQDTLHPFFSYANTLQEQLHVIPLSMSWHTASHSPHVITCNLTLHPHLNAISSFAPIYTHFHLLNLNACSFYM